MCGPGYAPQSSGAISATARPARSYSHPVVIVPIPRGNWQETVLPRAKAIKAELEAAGMRVMLATNELGTGSRPSVGGNADFATLNRRREGGGVDLPARCERERVDDDEVGRDHVPGQASPGVSPHPGQRDGTHARFEPYQSPLSLLQ